MSGIVQLISTFLQEHHHLIKDQMKRLKEFEKTAKKDVYFGKDGKKKVKQYVDPNKPKRADSAYIMFVKERIPGIKKANPNVKQNELFALIANQWSELDNKAKEAYNIKAAKGKEEYNKELAKYNAGLSSTSFEPTTADAKVASSVSSIISADKSKKRPAEDTGDEKKKKKSPK